MFIDDDAAKYARRRRCHCLREDGPIFGLVPAEEAELARLNTEFGEDLNEEFPPMNTIEHDVRWVTEFLKLLNRPGFPIIADAEQAVHEGGDLRPIAERLVSGTQHLAHPSLTALRRHIPEIKDGPD